MFDLLDVRCVVFTLILVRGGLSGRLLLVGWLIWVGFGIVVFKLCFYFDAVAWLFC